MVITYSKSNADFPCSADHEQDWQPFSIDSYSAICDDHTYTTEHTSSEHKGTLLMVDYDSGVDNTTVGMYVCMYVWSSHIAE